MLGNDVPPECASNDRVISLHLLSQSPREIIVRGISASFSRNLIHVTVAVANGSLLRCAQCRPSLMVSEPTNHQRSLTFDSL